MKQVLLISTCFFELHELEFVRPIEQICKKLNWKTKTVSYEDLDEKHIKNIDKVIICGTALKDNEYFDEAEGFGHLFEEFEGEILGICAGAQLMGAYYQGELIEVQEIGLLRDLVQGEDLLLKNCSLKEVYALHNYAIKNNQGEVLAQNKIPQLIKYSSLHYACMFHPEVRNHKLIENFLNL